MEQEPPCPWNSFASIIPASEGRLDILQWLRAQEPPCPWDEMTCINAVENCHLDVLQWLRAQDPPCPWDIEQCLNEAENTGNLEIEEWIRSQIIIVNLIKEQSSTIVIPDEECCICHANNVNIQTICLHNFCYECLNLWFHKEKKCPICRQDINDMCYEKSL